MNHSMQLLKKWINEADNIVFFGGAGVSTESGIKDFRSEDGLYNEKFEFRPEDILSHNFFLEQTEYFYEFYKEKLLQRGIRPNQAHRKLALLERMGKIKAVITQNIDGLHQIAGSKNVLELHGSVKRNYCMRCSKLYSDEFILQTRNIPTCICGGIVKPDIILYDEPLEDKVVSEAIKFISNTDLLIIGGTSLTVYPAAGIVKYFSGNKMIIINREATCYDDFADLVIRGNIAEVFEYL